MDYMVTMVISVIVIVGYTAAGRFLAAFTADFVRSIIMKASIIFCAGIFNCPCGRYPCSVGKRKNVAGFLSFQNYLEQTGGSEPYMLLISSPRYHGAGILGYATFSFAVHGY